MRRAGIFVVLTLLLLAVAGVTAAQEGVFGGNAEDQKTAEATSPERRDERAERESTEAEKTAPARTTEEPSEEKAPSAAGVTEGRSAGGGQLAENTAAEEPKPADQRQNAAGRPLNPQGESEAQDEPQAKGQGQAKGQTESQDRAKGKSAGNAKGSGEAEGKGKAAGGKGKAQAKGKAEGKGGDKGKADDGEKQSKVTVCHKPGKVNKTLTVGAPAEAAHLRHGDTKGACE